ncbi:MAG TPA: flavin reductase [Acetobacteraceae bacterium]|nr:flavin reductase [Acetobacteraceae bacterium]
MRRDGVAMVDQETFREAMARLGAAVNVITTAGPGGRGGCTASAVCSVTDDPPTLLVCLNRARDMHGLVKANGVLCVNTLAASQEGISTTFTGFTGLKVDERFTDGRWRALETGAPVLEGAVVSFDCAVSQVTEIGTHGVFFCEVAAIALGSKQEEALIYFRRRYHRTTATVVVSEA